MTLSAHQSCSVAYVRFPSIQEATMTLQKAWEKRTELMNARTILKLAHKGTPYLDRELVKVTTWIIAHQNRIDRKAERQKAA